MRIAVASAGELQREDLDCWRRIQSSDRVLGSPFLSPEFALAATAEGRDVRVAVMEDGGEVVGFFPHERGRLGIGGPAGGQLSHGHGVVASAGLEWSPTDLLRICGLVRWDFAHLVNPAGPFGPHCRLRLENPVIDLAGGYEGYVAERRRELIVTTQRKARKIEREQGPLRFTVRSADTRDLDVLMQWKSAQYRAIGTLDRFGLDWAVRLVRRVHSTRTHGFEGILSTLHVRDRLIAAHMGIRLGAVWSYWFPAYDPAAGRFSPGLILLLRMAECARAVGVAEIQLGAGQEGYKWHLASRSLPIGEGRVEVRSPRLLVLKAARAAGRIRQASSAGSASGT